MDREHLESEWHRFSSYAKSNGYHFYIGDLSFISYKTGDIVKLVGKGKVYIYSRKEKIEAEFYMLDGEEKQ